MTNPEKLIRDAIERAASKRMLSSYKYMQERREAYPLLLEFLLAEVSYVESLQIGTEEAENAYDILCVARQAITDRLENQEKDRG